MLGISELDDRQRLLWWQGVAYRRLEIRSTILAPMPLNWLIGWSRSLYYRLMHGPSDAVAEAFDSRLGEEYMKGHEQGLSLRQGRMKEEYQKGWDAAMAHVSNNLDNWLSQRELGRR